jgi:two-component system, OmpR family, alkaline phosphatase synthesis response regulator PhoP
MNRTLLVVDDEPSILETTRFILESEGYRVLAARDGEEALEVLRRERPPIVLLDVMIPKLNGFDVCRAIKADPELRSTFVLVLTARGQRADEAMALEAGADTYMRKPFDDEEILACIEAVFARLDAQRGVP